MQKMATDKSVATCLIKFNTVSENKVQLKL